MRRQVALHPVLLAAFPVVSLWSRNAGEVERGDVWPVLLLVVASVVVVGAIVTLFLRDHRKAALAVSGFAVLFFSYGHVSQLLERVLPSGSDRVLVWALPLAWLALAAGLVFVSLRAGRRLREATTILNGAALALVVVAGLPLLVDGARAAGSTDDAAAGPELVATTTSDRDIYYIVPDRYGSEDTLRRVFDFDNRPFLDHLESLGFEVADDAVAPYGKTAHSVAATLNLGYLDHLTDEVGTGSRSWRPVYKLLDDHAVGRFLRDQGYHYVHIGGWWDPTATSVHADVPLTWNETSDFSSTFWDTTAIRSLTDAVGVADMDLRTERRESVLWQLDQLERSAALDGPKFVFVHVTLPHDPYVFEADGSLTTLSEARSRTRAENFTNHVRYANRRLTALVEQLLSGPDERDPIVLIQADEGPYPVSAEKTYKTFRWPEATADDLREHLEVLSAFHLPGVEPGSVPETLSGVNAFRLILDRYFGTDLGLLPDRSYVFIDETHLYDFVDVTDRIRGG